MSTRHMHNSKTQVKQLYNEEEASEALGISVAMLHQILDRHIFTDGGSRPANVEFTSADLLMLSYWVDAESVEIIASMSKSG